MTKKKTGAMLTVDAEKELHRRMKAGETAALHELVVIHLPYGMKVVRRMCGDRITNEEVKSLAAQGLYEAAKTFDPTKGRFTAVCGFALRRAVYDMYQSQIGVDVSSKTYLKLLREGTPIRKINIEFLLDLQSKSNSASRSEDVYSAHGPDSAAPSSHALSTVATEHGCSWQELLALSSEDDGAGAAEREDRLAMLRSALGKLKPTHRLAIDLLFNEGLTLNEAGERFEPPVSGEWVRILRNEALTILRRALSKE